MVDCASAYAGVHRHGSITLQCCVAFTLCADADLWSASAGLRCRRERSGYRCIQKFGANYEPGKQKGGGGREPVRLLWAGGNHYDMIL